MKNESPQQLSCYQLTHEGEHLFRIQKYEQGIEYLQRALEIGTDDFSLLSTIYCQLGNAHVMLRDFETALKYHTYDILVERLIGNKEGEAKSCANLGNIFKMKGAFNDALSFTMRQLEFAEELGDSLMESRAYYNIASIHIERGRLVRLERTDENRDEKEIEAREDFENATKYFKKNLEIAVKNDDSLTMGRCYGSLGNVFYCLEEYDEAIRYHKLRLDLSQQYGDRSSMRRAHANIANCYMLQSNIQAAIQHYKYAYNLASELGNSAEEAQMAYSLANALYIAKEVSSATTYFLRHLDIARRQEDKSGQLRSYYSLALAFQHLRDLRKALYFLVLAKRTALQINDSSIIADIDNVLKNILETGKTTVLIDDTELIIDPSADPNGPQIEHKETLLTFFKKRSLEDRAIDASDPLAEEQYEKEEFFDMLARLQSKRMNDQRVDASVLNSNIEYRNRQADTEPDNSSTDGSEVLIDLLLAAQARRMEDQRAPFLPGLNENGQMILRRYSSGQKTSHSGARNINELDSHLVEWLMRVQSQRLDEQRSELPPLKPEDLIAINKKKEEDVTDIVLRMQAGRLEDQRAFLPPISSLSSEAGFSSHPVVASFPSAGPSSSSSNI